ncbi:hypothetical protein HA075_16705 [bacterium BFN5]|nr:hypothetical protein HA075_16705 [bacterium BFN5]
MLVKDIPCECKFEAGSTVTVVTSIGEERCLNRCKKDSHTSKKFCHGKISRGTQGVFHGIVLEETVIHLHQDRLQEMHGFWKNKLPSEKDKHVLVLSLLKPSPPFMAGQIVWIMVDQITAIDAADK